MKVEIEATQQFTEVIAREGRISARVWKGTTNLGTPVLLYVCSVVPDLPKPLTQSVIFEFTRDLDQAPTRHPRINKRYRHD